ncbi:MAG: helix-turn-helix domain-containing protein [Minisyncoccia bacterium]
MNIAKNLEQLGLSKAEAGVYLAAVQNGPLLPKHLAEKSGVKRSSLYEFLPRLIERGLLAETVKGKRTYLVAQDLQPFLDLKQAHIEAVEEALPQLRALVASAATKPQIIFHEGVEGVKRVYQDHLRERKEMLELVGIEKIHQDLQKYITDYYIPERTRRKISLKMLVSGKTVTGPFAVRSNSLELREVRTLSETLLKIPLGLNVYGESVSITLHRSDTEIVGLIIRSKEISEALRSILMFLWSSATETKK